MQSILITGVTGTLGRALARACLADPRWHRVIGFSRDEVKQSELSAEFGSYDPFRLFLGDVRDGDRLAMAFRGVDIVVHAAALKRIDSGTYNPTEMVVTNVFGTMNVINAAIHAGVKRVVFVSSDKAVAAKNLYGKTKGAAEDLAVHANTYGFPSGTLVSAVRYGNVLGSRGSVIHIWRRQAAAGQPLTLTDGRMTRFVMTIEQAVGLVFFALERMFGGEVFVPILNAATMLSLAEAVAPGHPVAEVGLRPGGEKLAEALLNDEEPSRTRVVRGGDYLAIIPGHHGWTSRDLWAGYDPVSPALRYASDTPAGDLGNRWLSVRELRDLIDGTEALR
jgi:UDP-N-acetylglucosamine 4,6-dehydratase/5-epimerase